VVAEHQLIVATST